jgi:hypothetical protein
MKVKIKEQSLFARLAARKLKSQQVAAVLGSTIHLWNVRREDFLQSTTWVLHELEHVRQFRKYGAVRFLVLYLWESARRGYYNNRFEAEARLAERGKLTPDDVVFLPPKC